LLRGYLKSTLTLCQYLKLIFFHFIIE